MLALSGKQQVIDLIAKHPAWQNLPRQGRAIDFGRGASLFDALRSIETMFIASSNKARPSSPGLGFFGYIGYDAIFSIEKIPKCIDRRGCEDEAQLAIYEGIIHTQLDRSSSSLTVNTCPLWEATPIDHILASMDSNPAIESDSYNYTFESLPTVSRNTYLSWVNKAKRHISIGDIYQIQLGHEIRIDATIPPIETYRRLRKFNPSPYMYYFGTEDGMTVAGASPELFVSLDHSRKVQMRPIAGTARKGTSEAENKSITATLLSDEKECAEHLMLVDLCRNDVSRVCDASTLNVDELMVTEAYSHVIHIVSNVSGYLRTSKDKYDLVAATFPAGTMTGTPKIRAVEIIEDTEISSRGIYAGCIGFFGFDNTMVTALCIRTTTWRNGRYSIRASGGVVEDSTPEGEWNETISKLSSPYFAITNKDLRSEDFTC
ncbi:anthranilate synthase component I [Dyella caseinilytica]|nr:anthranilate synthase component I [Dyella caseinilytica]